MVCITPRTTQRVAQLANTQPFNNFSRVLHHPGELHKHLNDSMLQNTLRTTLKHHLVEIGIPLDKPQALVEGIGGNAHGAGGEMDFDGRHGAGL